MDWYPILTKDQSDRRVHAFSLLAEGYYGLAVTLCGQHADRRSWNNVRPLARQYVACPGCVRQFIRMVDEGRARWIPSWA